MKKLFGGINLTWIKLIIIAVLVGVYTAFVAMMPSLKDTSFHDIAVTFEVWIFFGIFIIMNSKSAKESALKSFVFFLISQPLVYLVQDAITGSNLFNTFYKYWFMWTVGCIPMGFIGYFMKKDKWWGLFILCPMLIFLGLDYSRYTSLCMFSFPRHLLTLIFCVGTLLIYPIAIFKNKIARYVSLIVSFLVIIVFGVMVYLDPPVYSTEIFSAGKYQFDKTYKVYLVDKKYGDLSITYDEAIEDYLVHAEFKKAGKTKFVLESPEGDKKTFSITIKRDTYSYKELKN